MLVDGFAVRHGSGGHGAHRGGDGVVRRITFPRGDDGGDPLRSPPRAALWHGRRRARGRG
ncbi:MAG: hydantoinase B/oxoprolinase family protein [Dongiaceae bacterium]